MKTLRALGCLPLISTVIACTSLPNREPNATAKPPEPITEKVIFLPKAVYSEKVHLFYRESDVRNKSIIVSFHFLGWDQGQGQERYFREINWKNFIAQTQFQGMIIVPETKDNIETYKKHLFTPDGFRAFIESLQIAAFQEAKIKDFEKVVLSAHSGSTYVIGQLWQLKLNWNRIYAIGLFDSLYENQHDGIIQFAVQNKGRIPFYSNYLIGSDTEPYNEALKESLTKLRYTNSQVEALSQTRFNHLNAFTLCYPKFLDALKTAQLSQVNCTK